MVITNKLKPYLLLVSILFVFAAITAGDAFAVWLDPDWGFRQMITIDSTQVPVDQSSFPVLVSVTDPNLRVMPAGNVGNADGSDIAFTMGDAFTQLDHEIESYNSATGELVAWVEVPNVSSTVDTIIYMYYGNPGAADQQNVNATWDSNYRGVWHEKDLTTSTIKDSTLNANNGIKTAANEPIEVDGQIGKAQSYDGLNDYVSVSSGMYNFGIPDPYTLSVWFKRTTSDNNGTIFSKWQDALPRGILIVNFPLISTMLFIMSRNDVTGEMQIRYDSGMPPVDTWALLTFTYNGNGNANGVVYYINGVVQTPTVVYDNLFDTLTNGADVNFGRLNTNIFYSDGVFDEVRISDIVRSPEWIETSYNNQNNPFSFMAFGPQQVFTPVPTMTKWGMIVFMLLAGLGAIYFLTAVRQA